MADSQATQTKQIMHPISKILEAVSCQMANGWGFVRKGKVDYFNSTVTVDVTVYRVKVAWPDGAEAHELNPDIECL